MRSVYLQESRNLPGDPVGQVRILNASILSFVVPRIMEEVRSYMQYQRDIATLPVPMERGQLATSKGTRTLEIRRF
jgi:hypothetical protein